MTLGRSGLPVRLRVSLVAMVVAIATIFALVGSYVRAPDAVLGIAFARACAAEVAVMEQSHPRLRVDHEDMRLDDIDGVVSAPRVTKTRVPPRVADEGASLRLVAATTASRLALLELAPPNSGLAWPPASPPTRGRARLMVFLN